MTNGPSRFNLYLDKLEQLLLNASKQDDPAFWLYQNGARTPLFMLEGLAKLYGGLHNKNRFSKLEEQFKLLEDGIGAIDHYDAFAKEFAADPNIPAEAAQFVQTKRDEKAAALNRLLKQKKWLGDSPKRLVKIRKKLRKADWLNDDAEVKAIEAYYRNSIEKINDFADQYKNGFTELETQVHELRRKLRWLSIYPQALQGAIQLTETASKDEKIKKYLTPEVVNSPFNKMPDAGANRHLLTLKKDYFLALSWMIAELGKLKDEGLRFFTLTEASKTSSSDAKNDAAILSKASDITQTFFGEKNLDKMIGGSAK